MKPRSSISPNPEGVLEALRRNPDALTWPQRAEVATALREQPGIRPGTALWNLLEMLAGDPKPEVRHAVAQGLPFLGEAEFVIACRWFASDANAYVRRCVARAQGRRSQARKVSHRQTLGFDQVTRSLRQIEVRHGRMAAQAARRVAQRYTELLAGSMVHDLRSILTHLRANALALSDQAHKAGASPTLGQRVKEDIDFLERTIRDMERFTTSVTGERTPVRLCELVQAALEQAQSHVRVDAGIDPAAVTVKLEVPASIRVPVIPHLMVAALVNILKNAFESFAHRQNATSSPRIGIAASADQYQAELQIRDNGMGFAPEEKAAFQPLASGRRNNTKRNSTGYGLPNAMRHVAAHGGELTIDSQENCGTTITVRLPLHTTLDRGDSL